MRIIFFLLCSIGMLSPGLTQKILQIEKYGSPKTKKLFIGQKIKYKLEGDDIWYQGYIDDLIVDREIIALEDRYINMNDIEAFRYNRSWSGPVGISLYTFGAAWSGFALIGTITDGDPDTNYRSSDAIVSGVAIGLGFVVQRFLAKKTVRFGKRRRLRMLDLTFKKPENP